VSVCSDAREVPDGKWSEEDAGLWQTSRGSHLVVIQVRGGLRACPEPLKAGDVIDYTVRWNGRLQQCVRTLIEGLGGQMQGDVGLLNQIYADVTWGQIQEIGELPDVRSIRDLGRPPIRE
jgi:hypothetical protein